jgi:hypothetical protein
MTQHFECVTRADCQVHEEAKKPAKQFLFFRGVFLIKNKNNSRGTSKRSQGHTQQHNSPMTRFGHSSGRSFSFLFLSDFESQEQQQQLIGSAIKRRRRRFQSSSFLLKVKPVASLRIRGEREREKKEPSLVA